MKKTGSKVKVASAHAYALFTLLPVLNQRYMDIGAFSESMVLTATDLYVSLLKWSTFVADSCRRSLTVEAV